MPRQKIKLTFHKRSRRYRKMHKGRMYESKVVAADTREEKRRAWEEFKLFRSKVDLEFSPSDESTPFREYYEPAIQDQQRMAEWYAYEGDREMLARINANIKDLKRDYDTSEPPPSPFYNVLPADNYGGGSLVWQDRYRLLDKMKSSTEHDLTVSAQVDRFLKTKARQAKAGDRSVGRYGKLRNSLNYFMAWHGAGQSVYTLTGMTLQKFYDHLLDEIRDKNLSRYTARDHLQAVKQFTEDCATLIDDLPMPKNIRTRQLVIKVKGSNETVVFTPDELQMFVTMASERTALYLLLMANIGATQKDLADLHPLEVKWKAGRIVRKRSKTEEYETVPEVNYKLWPSTLKLLRQHGLREGEQVLLNEKGGLLVKSTIREDGNEKRNDCTRSAYNRLVTKLKNRNLVSQEFSKTLTDIRSTGADALAKKPAYKGYHGLYLGHATKTVAEIHYLTHGEVDPEFDKAVEWLGRKLGLYQIDLKGLTK
jgi:hypothetical protein